MKNNWKWLYPGIGVKRWMFLIAISFILISVGIFFLIDFQLFSFIESRIVGFLVPLVGSISSSMIRTVIAAIFIITGLWGVNAAFKGAFRNFSKNKTQREIVDQLYQEKILEQGPRVVALGGGTGLSNLLRGIKKYTSNITAVVTVADDGGSSGKLRDELDMLPPGDIRNCLVALADVEPLMKDLFQYRFSSEGHLVGHSFGNLFIASLTEILGDFEEAVKESSRVLAIKGQVLPATNENIRLGALYSDKSIKIGESVIPELDKKIEKVFLKPSSCKPTSEALAAIQEADIIVVGPGSLYTSILPNLLVDGIGDAIDKSKAVKYYICNVMTQPGETSGYSASDHIQAIIDHIDKNIFDRIIVNKEQGSKKLAKKYEEEGAYPVETDYKELNKLEIEIMEGNLLTHEDYIRHDPEELARLIFKKAESR
ncbi:MAG: gluconeogenesis factor YvcK family protein [Halanaerobiales bacterium]